MKSVDPRNVLVPPLPLKKKKKHVFLPKRVGWPLDSSVTESSDSLTPSTGTQVPCPSSFLLSFPPYLPSFFPFFFTLLEAKNTFLFCTLDPATGASHLEKGRGFACVTTSSQLLTRSPCLKLCFADELPLAAYRAPSKGSRILQ